MHKCVIQPQLVYQKSENKYRYWKKLSIMVHKDKKITHENCLADYHYCENY